MRSEMMFIVVPTRCGAKVLKSWYGFVVNDSSMLFDVYNDFHGRTLDDGPAIPENYQGAAVAAYVVFVQCGYKCFLYMNFFVVTDC